MLEVSGKKRPASNNNPPRPLTRSREMRILPTRAACAMPPQKIFIEVTLLKAIRPATPSASTRC